ncbi:oxidoreductase [Lactococcus hodotermopsidis]|uniref:Oxidoreductase n=1 Tax=Pseudolactococcus hodotermopsidis TaxID=2709157 RepID=A0A6A0BC48_9LACT|nr:Gfo/Idh/MocA family oxidoreductase [Lactococcus hodotermopsidis]GFH42235.1 oxidoreductase [Lactococcus hodotermopsidis]
MKKLNIAYIGFGKSTNRYHIPYVKSRDNMRIGRIYARTLGKNLIAQAELEATGTIFTTDVADIIDDETIDLVVVVTPANTHFALVKQLLLAGKNVMVDKPAVEKLSEMEELIDIAKMKNCFFMPFQNRRFDSDFLTVEHILKTGYLGRIIDLEVHMDHFRPDETIYQASKINGAFYGHGVHLVDQMIALFGKPEKVSYDIRATRNPQSHVDDHFEVGLFYADNMKATIQATEMALVSYPKWLIQGTNGSYIKYNMDQQENDLKSGIMPSARGFGEDVPQDFGKLTYFNQSGDRIEKFMPAIVGDYGRIYDNVFDVLVNGAEKVVTDAQMLAVIELLENGFG